MNYSAALKNPIFKTIQIVSDELNYPTYVVGGWVRDLLLNRKQEKKLILILFALEAA